VLVTSCLQYKERIDIPLDFRPLVQEDMQFITDLLNEESVVSTLHCAVMDYAAWLSVYLNSWRDDTDEAHFILISDGTPIGWLKLNGLDGREMVWIAMLVICEAAQNKGYGKHAIAFSESFAKEKGFCKIGIHTTCDNLAAIALYCKSGYRLTEYGGCTTGDGQQRTGYTFMKVI